MRCVVGVADNRWATFLRDQPDVIEAYFGSPLRTASRRCYQANRSCQDERPEGVLGSRYSRLRAGRRRLLRRVCRITSE
jgi:hypothetical protein